MSYWDNRLTEAKAKVRATYAVLRRAEERNVFSSEHGGWGYARAYMKDQCRQAVEELLSVYRDYRRTR